MDIPVAQGLKVEASPPLDFLQIFATLRPIMSEYGRYIMRQKPAPLLSSDPVQRFFEKKRRLQAENAFVTHR